MVAQPPGDESSGSGLRGPLVGLATATVYFVAAKVGLSLAFEAAPGHHRVAADRHRARGRRAASARMGWPRHRARRVPRQRDGRATPVATAAGIAVGNTLEAVRGRVAPRAGRLPAGRSTRLRDALALIIFAAGASTIVSATIGVVEPCAGGVQPWTRSDALWWAWWVGDALGALVVAPLLLVWATPQPDAAAVADVGSRRSALVARDARSSAARSSASAATLAARRLSAALRSSSRSSSGRRSASASAATATVTFLVSALAIWSTVARLRARSPRATRAREPPPPAALHGASSPSPDSLLGAAITERDAVATAARARLRDAPA